MRIDNFSFNPWNTISQGNVSSAVATAYGSNTDVSGIDGTDKAEQVEGVEGKSGGPGKVGKTECQTCKNRKYQDGSDEMVSFKSAAHIDPGAAGARVRAHEQEHVSNAYKKAATDGGKVIRASVSIHMSVCPECGRSYVSGGTTNTAIKYDNSNPYQKNAKSFQAEATKGNNIDASL